MKWLGVDIGGANVKVADGNGFAESMAFEMWKHSAKLSQQLRAILAQSPSCDHLAVTMTGELADCFANKTEGVQFIIQAVEAAADGRHTRIYLTNGMLVTPQVALRRPYEVAAANWHALARYCGRFAKRGAALLIDVGSTTTDIVPLDNGIPIPRGLTDTDRLLAGELVYLGIERTPLCAVVESVPYRGAKCSVARELFATSLDIALVLGHFAEEATNVATADGRSRTKGAAKGRLAKLICADDSTFNFKDAVTMADAIAESMAVLVARGIEKVISQMPSPPIAIIVGGHGEWLVAKALDLLANTTRTIPLAKTVGVAASRCAPAHALAVLAAESTKT